MGNAHTEKLASALDKACHPLCLGRNREMADPLYDLKGHPRAPELRKEMIATEKDAREFKPKLRAWEEAERKAATTKAAKATAIEAAEGAATKAAKAEEAAQAAEVAATEAAEAAAKAAAKAAEAAAEAAEVAAEEAAAAAIEAAIAKAAKDSHKHYMLKAHHEVGYNLQYGKYAARPHIPIGSPLGVAQDYLEGLYELVQSSSDRFMATVLSKEVQIQQEIEKLAREDLDGLRAILEDAWADTVTSFNKASTATPSWPRNSDFLLGSQDCTIPEVSAPDLTVFSVDFLMDLLLHSYGNNAYDQIVPIYRTGANYKDLRPVWEQKTLPPVEPGNITYNANFVEHLRRIRPSYLVPHINLPDLIDPLNLLSFIHYRGRVPPFNFAHIDNELTYTGRQTKILSGHFYYQRMVHISDRGLYESTGCGRNIAQPYVGRDKFTEMEAYHLKQKFGVAEAFVLLKSQSFTYSFLSKVCDRVLRRDGVEDPRPTDLKLFHDQMVVDVHFDDVLTEVDSKASRRLQELKNASKRGAWLTLAALKNYEPTAPSIQVDIFEPCLDGKMQRAEEHLKQLFDDPDYFAHHVIQERKHHWCNVRLWDKAQSSAQIENYCEIEPRHHLYYDCLRRVLRRAIFEFFMWTRVKEALLKFAGDMEEAQPGHARIPSPSGFRHIWPDPPILVDLDRFREKSTGKSKKDTSLPEQVEADKQSERDSQLRKPSELPKLPPLDPEVREELLRRYQDLVILVRYCAIFFLNDFRVHAIHAGSEPLRSEFVRHGKDVPDPNKRKNKRQNKQVCHFDGGHYRGKIHRFDRSHSTLHLENSKPTICDLIDNFIADKAASMHVGIRKVTQHLQEILDDVDDPEFGNLTSLVADSIDGLDLLAELADHLERWHPMVEYIRDVWGEDTRETRFSYALGNKSIDFMKFDSFPFEQNAVPHKRIERIFSFLDEMQGFKDGNLRTTSEARGDLKRLGASLLRDSIEKINKSIPSKASEQTIQRLEECMGVTRKEFPFDPKEQPYAAGDGGLTTQSETGKLVPRTMPDHSRYKDEAAEFRSRKENTKPPDTGFADIVVDHNKRQALYKNRSKMQWDRWVRKRKRYRNSRESAMGGGERETQQAQSRDEAAMDIDDDAAGVEPSTETDGPGAQHQPAIQAPVVQLPLPPAPPIRPPHPTPTPTQPTQPTPPRRRIAPDQQDKKVLSKRVWKTFQSIYGESRTPVSWEELVRAMDAIGYNDSGRGGSHAVFTLANSCRWTMDHLPKGRHIQLSKNHEGSRKAAARGKARNWGHWLTEKGLSWKFIKTWHCSKG